MQRLNLIKPQYFLASSLCALAAIFASPAQAGDGNGTIGVSIVITNACVINGATAVQTNLGQIGTISFPDQPGLFGNVDGEMVGTLGALQVLCSPGSTPSLTIGAGAHDATGRRHMASSGNTLPYRLYRDAARTNEIAIGQQLPLGTATTTAFSVPIYARVNSGGLVLAAGTYTDTVQVTLTF